jgi:hypothetical protein
MQITGPIFSLKNQVGIGDLISSDRFLQLANDLNIPYFKRDFLFRGGVWRGARQNPICFGRNETKFVMIGHGDKPTSNATQQICKMLGVESIFGTNLSPIEGYSKSIPLGLTNPTNETPLHQIFGEIGHFEKAWVKSDRVNHFDRSVLVGFSANTNKIRAKLLKMLRSNQHGLRIVHHNMEFSDTGRIDYLVKSHSTSMVLCPEGNGFDTHRFWETLYMGGVPVVVANPYLDTLFDNVPCIKLKSWNDLSNTVLLESLWHEANNKEWDASFISFSYWRREIEKSAKGQI